MWWNGASHCEFDGKRMETETTWSSFPNGGKTNHFFNLYQQNKSSESKVKFRQAINPCKRVLEAPKIAYGNKTRELITSQKLGSLDFWQIANSFLFKGKSAIPPIINSTKAYALTLPFWKDSSHPLSLSWNLPFWDDPDLNVTYLWIF